MGKDPKDFEKKNNDWGNDQRSDRPGRSGDGVQDVTDWDKAPRRPKEDDKEQK